MGHPVASELGCDREEGRDEGRVEMSAATTGDLGEDIYARPTLPCTAASIPKRRTRRRPRRCALRAGSPRPSGRADSRCRQRVRDGSRRYARVSWMIGKKADPAGISAAYGRMGSHRLPLGVIERPGSSGGTRSGICRSCRRRASRWRVGASSPWRCRSRSRGRAVRTGARCARCDGRCHRRATPLPGRVK